MKPVLLGYQEVRVHTSAVEVESGARVLVAGDGGWS